MHHSEKRAVGTAHSKIILIGEHAVVYGEPAIALPFPTLSATCIVEHSYGKILFEGEKYTGPLERIPERMKGLALCINETLLELGQKQANLKITLISNIPIARGLGSSAATAMAIVRGLSNYFATPLTKTKLKTLGNIAEKYAHGNPSGIDMETVFSDVPILFQKGFMPKPLFIQKPFYLVVADTGEIRNTKLAVASILAKRKQDPKHIEHSIHLLGLYTRETKDVLMAGDLSRLGELLNLAQIELKNLGVSDEPIDHLVNVAKNEGALGAKLTGAGRGGCIIALAENGDHASMLCKRLREAGATETWFFKVEQDSEQLSCEEWGENIESNR
ncbi:MAG: mevalonate kinase [Bacillus sp. (in: Bacteria)]|nr:mevalonate kinase [Bacillus sp. (in: firmicutes)]